MRKIGIIGFFVLFDTFSKFHRNFIINYETLKKYQIRQKTNDANFSHQFIFPTENVFWRQVGKIMLLLQLTTYLGPFDLQ